jgi:hypothetical protein
MMLKERRERKEQNESQTYNFILCNDFLVVKSCFFFSLKSSGLPITPLPVPQPWLGLYLVRL